MDTPTPRRGQADYSAAPRAAQTGGEAITSKSVPNGTIRSRSTTGGAIKGRGKTETTKVGGTGRSRTKAVPGRPAPAQARQGLRVPADDPLSRDRVTYLLSVFTSKRLARWLGVSPSQTSRWSQGHERPGPAVAAELIDLEHVYARARLVWGEEAAGIWLDSPNSFLDGGRPLDVLYADGPGRVLESLDAEMWGGAA